MFSSKIFFCKAFKTEVPHNILSENNLTQMKVSSENSLREKLRPLIKKRTYCDIFSFRMLYQTLEVIFHGGSFPLQPLFRRWLFSGTFPKTKPKSWK